ncbi:MAG: isoprenylcysteine carboxylmethyltransferase family protein [Proteobacteria bacterium]|nr:isoprenylcysteine carboxylmethyltransferase family protein [Pseudomonadota bacterium]
MGRFVILLYGVIAYLIFLLTFLYAIGFMGNFLVPKSIDSGADGPLLNALIINVILLSIFAVQHSVMARPAFKAWWTKIVPKAAERSTYTLLSSLCLILLFYYWQPMGGIIWQVEGAVGQAILYSLFGFGWALVLVSTFLINHFDLFGLRQVWLNFTGQEYTSLKFGTPGPYKLIRHPLYLGWFFAFWATPTMTVAHLAFAIITTVYILLAIQWEEKDLLTALGEDYANYRKTVPMIIPFTK